MSLLSFPSLRPVTFDLAVAAAAAPDFYTGVVSAAVVAAAVAPVAAVAAAQVGLDSGCGHAYRRKVEVASSGCCAAASQDSASFNTRLLFFERCGEGGVERDVASSRAACGPRNSELLYVIASTYGRQSTVMACLELFGLSPWVQKEAFINAISFSIFTHA